MRPPISIGTSALAAATLGAATLAANPGDFDRGATFVVLAGTILIGLTGFVGLALVGAPWGRWTLLGSVGIGLIFASITGSWLFWLTTGLGGVAAVGLMGPWLRVWVRHRPAANAPHPIVIALMAIGPASGLYIGLVALERLDVAHLVLLAVTMVSSWAYGRGLPFGIWGLRVVVPAVGAFTAGYAVGVGGVLLGVAVLAITVASWTPQARSATAVVTPPLPPPAVRSSRSMPDAPK